MFREWYDMVKRVAELPQRSAIYYPTVRVDARGVPQEGDIVLLRFIELGRAPIFTHVDSHFGKGIVGGPMFSSRAGPGVPEGKLEKSLRHFTRPTSMEPASDWPLRAQSSRLPGEKFGRRISQGLVQYFDSPCHLPRPFDFTTVVHVVALRLR